MSRFNLISSLLIVGLSVLALLSIPLVKADSVQIHLASKHITGKDRYDFNEFNPGLTLTKDFVDGGYVMAGTYLNSLDRQTWTFGVGWREGIIGLECGVATGYTMTATPMVSPYFVLDPVKVNLMPIVSHDSAFDGVALGFSLEFDYE